MTEKYYRTHNPIIKIKCKICHKIFGSIHKALCCSKDCMKQNKIKLAREWYIKNKSYAINNQKNRWKKIYKPKEDNCIICNNTFVHNKANKHTCSKQCQKIENDICHQKFKQNNPNYNKIYSTSKKGFLIIKKNNILRRDRKKQLGEKMIKGNGLDIQNIFEKFNSKCYNCGMTNEQHKVIYNEELNLDHYNPLINKFQLTENNCVLLCRACNSRKRDKKPINFFNSEQIKELETIYGVIIL